jgi:hypothetical protein
MPMFFAGRHKHNVPNGHDLLFLSGGYNALSSDDYQDLFRIVSMEFVSHSLSKVYMIT